MSAGDDTAAPLQIDVVRGHPTDDELAALIAVVSEVYSREEATATASETRRDAWMVAARNVHTPLRRELGWRNFTG